MLNKKPVTAAGAVANQPPSYVGMQNIQDQLQGVGATITGQPYNVFRIKPTSTGNVMVRPNLIQFHKLIDRAQTDSKSNPSIEGTKANEIYWFKVLGDFTCNKTGDIFVLDDPYFGVGATQVNYNSGERDTTGMPKPQINGFVLAIHPVLRLPIGARIDRTITIGRPQTSAASPDGYLDTTSNKADQLILSNGKFRLAPTGSVPSHIPAGMLPIRRQKNLVLSDVPDMPLKTLWSCYTIPLPGYMIVENDIVTDSYGAVYRVISPGRQDVGLVGNQMLLEREISAIDYPY